MNHLLNPKIKAETLSVLMSVSGSITCGVTLDCGEGEEYSNVTLRFEDESARIAGYPQNWKTHDEPIDGNEEYTYGEAEEDGGIDDGDHEIEAIHHYVSRKTEQEILRQLKKSLEKQFQDEMFKDDLSKKDQQTALEKIDLAIKNLE
jgi:hypothetical protein